MKKLAIIITHPIQYYVPIFKLLAQQCQLKVFYTWGNNWLNNKYDPGFGKNVEWDIPLLEGYDYEFLENIAKQPGSHHSKGIVNPKLITAINHYQPHVLLVHGYSYQSHFKIMRHFKGKIPIWFRGDSTLIDEKKGIKSILKKIYLKWIYSHVNKAFYVGQNNKAYFKKYGLKDKDLIFASHAIDNTRFAENRKAEADNLRASLGIVEKDILILFAGKLEPKKSPGLLLEAFVGLTKEQGARNKEQGARSKEQGAKNKEQGLKIKDKGVMHLLFVGNGILEKNLKLKAKEYLDKLSMTPTNQAERFENAEVIKRKSPIVNHIHFMDFQNQTQMPVVYQACDIFCLPSQGPGETWGLAINEAMAAGKAIIASDKVGCAVDLIKNGVNGYIFKSGSAADLERKLSLLINRPEAIRSFGEQSKSIIQQWSFEEQVSTFIKQLNATN